MKSHYNVYTIIGSNGYGIVSSWNECQKCQKYFRQFRTKGFYTYESAYEWIVNTFTELYEIGGYEFCGLDYLKRKNLLFLRKGKVD